MTAADDNAWLALLKPRFCFSATTGKSGIPEWLDERDLDDWRRYIDRELGHQSEPGKLVANWAKYLELPHEELSACYIILARVMEAIQHHNPSALEIDLGLMPELTLHFIFSRVCTLQHKNWKTAEAGVADNAYMALIPIFGALTMLYYTQGPPGGNGDLWTISVASCGSVTTSEPMLISSRFADAPHRHVGQVLRNFSDLLPSVPEDRDELLYARFLNYATLKEWAGIRIQWVDQIQSHLDFNQRKKILYIFAYPVYSALWCDEDLRIKLFDK